LRVEVGKDHLVLDHRIHVLVVVDPHDVGVLGRTSNVKVHTRGRVLADVVALHG